MPAASELRACPDAAALAELADGELTGDAAEVVRVHLGECDGCRTAIARLLLLRGHPHDPHAWASSGVEPVPGDIVGERYRLARRIGRGAMGTVFEAWDPVLERRVALKLLRERSALDPELLAERLLRESRALAKLRHPNVVAIYDVGASAGRPYLAMEFVAGHTLRQWLEDAPRSWRDVLEIFVQAGRGLAAAHAVGLVHRDFKPDNVLVREAPSDADAHACAMVLDFGLVRVVAQPIERTEHGLGDVDARAGTLTQSGRLVGTPAYMAPEQFEGGDVDARADVFAFCTALYEGLFGVRPFVGTNVAALRLAIAGRSLQRPRRGRDVPAWLERAVIAGLAADREQRPADLGALLERLRASPRRWPYAIAGLAGLSIAVALAPWGAEPSEVEAPTIAATPSAHELEHEIELAPLPSDPAQRREVEELRNELAALRALIEAGRADEARTRLAALEPRIARVDYPPIFALAAYTRSLLAIAANDFEGAKAALLEAAQLATASEFDQLAAQAWVELVFVATDYMRDFARAHEYEGNARASIARLAEGPARDELESRRASHAGNLLSHEGRFAEARTEYGRALAFAERRLAVDASPADEEFAADALEGIALVDGRMHRMDDAIAAYERVLAVRIRLLGPEHPRTAMTYANLGGLEQKAGRLEQSLVHNRRSREIYEALFGTVNADVAIAIANEAGSLGRLGRHDEAILAYDQAIAIIDATEGPTSYTAARLHDQRGRALLDAGRAPEAVVALERARTLYEAGAASLDPEDLPECLAALAKARAAGAAH